MADTDFTTEIQAFLNQRPKLLASYGASWVVFVGERCVGHFATYAQAAEYALAHHRAQRFLIRNTNAVEPDIPMLFVEG